MIPLKEFLHTRTRRSIYLVLRVAVAISALLVGASFCIIPSANALHKSHPFYFVNLLSNTFSIPWWFYGVWLLIAGVVLFFRKTRPVGFLLGGIIYTFFAIATFWAVVTGHSDSILAVTNLTTVAILYWSALRISIYDQVDPERKVVG